MNPLQTTLLFPQTQIIILISAIVFGVICMKMAEKRNYTQKYWGFSIGFLFGIVAVIGYLILAIVEKKYGK